MMKKFFIIVSLSFLYPVSVTFNVDMQEQYLLGGFVHLSGADSLTSSSFGVLDSIQIPAWTPSAISMNDDNYDGIFSTTIELDSNTVYTFKYVNGLVYELLGEPDRIFETSVNDTVLNVVCFDKINGSCQEVDNSLVEVIFSVDMQQVQLTDSTVGLLGTNQDFSNFGYEINTLNPIPPYDPSYLSLTDDDGDDVYSITLFFQPGVVYEYKFINGNDWGGVEQTDRTIIVPEVSGFNLNEVCFNANEDCAEFTTLIDHLTFKTDVSSAISNDGFELGDMLVIKWGYGESQPFEMQDTLELLPFSYSYEFEIDSVLISEERGMYYQYYKILDAIDYREIFFNFEYEGDDIVLAERRYFSFENLNDFTDVSIEDIVNSNVEQRRMPIFLNTDFIGEETQVTWTIDLSPAYYQILAGDTLIDIQGLYNVDNVDSLYQWGVWINGPASMPANGETWTQWGPTLQGTTSKKMWDDGTHGDDIAGDHIYTIKLNYSSDDQIGQECKFGIKGGDNESSYGLNHYHNINILDPNIHVYWGSINPVFYDAWDYDLNVPIDDSLCVPMDLNEDGVVNVIDIISVVNIIIGNIDPTTNQSCAADINSDDQINVVDIISIVNFIIESI